MKISDIPAKGKAGFNLIGAMWRRYRTERAIDALQREMGLLNPPSETMLALTSAAERICMTVKNDAVLGDYFISNNPWQSRPWRSFNYWNGWYGLAREFRPATIVEIGTAFGFSTISLARGGGEGLKLLISLDLGNFGRLFSDGGEPEMDNLAFVKKGIEAYRQESGYGFEYRQFAVNTQPPPYTDNEGHPVTCPYWKDDTELTGLLTATPIDLLLIDGKHTEDGLYHDVTSFFPYMRSGGLVICDDLQHPDAARSFHRFITESPDVADYFVWRFLHNNSEYGGTLLRNQGLLLKR